MAADFDLALSNNELAIVSHGGGGMIIIILDKQLLECVFKCGCHVVDKTINGNGK